MNPENPVPEPLVPRTTSGFQPVIFSFSVSTGVLFLLNISLTPTYHCSNYLLPFMAWLTFFLGSITSLLSTMKSTELFGRIYSRFIDHLTRVTLVFSLATLILALPELSAALADLYELSHGDFGWAIQSGLICFAVSGLYKLIREKFTSCHLQSLGIAFFNLSIVFAGLYAGPLYLVTGTTAYNSFIYQTDWLYHVALIPITCVSGTIVLVLGVVPAAELQLPFDFVISKEDITVSALAMGLTTLLTGAFVMIYMVVADLAMSGGFGVGGLAEQ